MNRASLFLAAALSLPLAACGADHRVVREAAARTPAAEAQAQARLPQCDRDNGGLTLPPGFCALIVAQGLGGIRHVAVAPNGDIYLGTQGRRGSQVGVVALRDTTGDGKADVTERFYDRGGTGIEISGGWLYFSPDSGVVRWRMPQGRLVPAGQPQTIVWGLPTGGHTAKSMALDGRGALFVNVGSRTNACQAQDRQVGA
ncbi:MAG TPA: hypothetical protein VFQ39_12535, partial [Longimicrobium sp.]|nr:hypothetical protein [Longimicrobium sp.]